MKKIKFPYKCLNGCDLIANKLIKETRQEVLEEVFEKIGCDCRNISKHFERCHYCEIKKSLLDKDKQVIK